MAIIQAIQEQKSLAESSWSVAGAKILMLIGKMAIATLCGDVAGIPVRARHLWANGYMGLCVRSDGIDHIRQLVGFLYHYLKSVLHNQLN